MQSSHRTEGCRPQNPTGSPASSNAIHYQPSLHVGGRSAGSVRLCRARSRSSVWATRWMRTFYFGGTRAWLTASAIMSVFFDEPRDVPK